MKRKYNLAKMYASLVEINVQGTSSCKCCKLEDGDDDERRNNFDKNEQGQNTFS